MEDTELHETQPMLSQSLQVDEWEAPDMHTTVIQGIIYQSDSGSGESSGKSTGGGGDQNPERPPSW